MTAVASVSRLGGAVVAATLALLGGVRAQPAVEGALDLNLRLDVQTRPAAQDVPDLDARLGFIEQRLDDQRRHSRLWQYGWASANTFGLVGGAADGVAAGNHDARVTGIVVAAKSPRSGSPTCTCGRCRGSTAPTRSAPCRATPRSSSRSGSPPPSGC